MTSSLQTSFLDKLCNIEDDLTEHLFYYFNGIQTLWKSIYDLLILGSINVDFFSFLHTHVHQLAHPVGIEVKQGLPNVLEGVQKTLSFSPIKKCIWSGIVIQHLKMERISHSSILF